MKEKENRAGRIRTFQIRPDDQSRIDSIRQALGVNTDTAAIRFALKYAAERLDRGGFTIKRAGNKPERGEDQPGK